jgi:hypothetical protein
LDKVKRKRELLAIVLIAIISISVIAASNIFNCKTVTTFYVGVEFAYAYDEAAGMPALINDLKGMVNEVKDYTNLFVIGTPEISKNQTALDEACDYIYAAKLKFIVLFTDSTQYQYANNYTPFKWISDAKQRYGDQFIGIFRFDEPGGNQLYFGRSRMVSNATDYRDAASKYVESYTGHLGYWKNLTEAAKYDIRMVTADYGLYWFDYKGGYDAVFAEFGWNQSRELTLGLCRGAAQVQGKEWGTIITWTYTEAPYIESAPELYNDMILAYQAGAKYVIVFDYPKIGQHGLLTQMHLDAMKNFWNFANNNPQKHSSLKSSFAYVLPEDYGFGFRRPNDNIWGLWNADELSPKIWNDTTKLSAQYGSNLDIVYDDPEYINTITERYDQLYFWNETIP